jgi:peptide deformylase
MSAEQGRPGQPRQPGAAAQGSGAQAAPEGRAAGGAEGRAAGGAEGRAAGGAEAAGPEQAAARAQRGERGEKTLPIVSAGDPVLRGRAAEVDEARLGSKDLLDLVELMINTMRAAPGVGLAAPQIGLPLRVIVLEDPADVVASLDAEARAARGRVAFPVVAIINPVLRLLEGPGATFFEGCLSVPGYAAQVTRALEVEVTGKTPMGEPVQWRVSGWPARILQHECDHLDGTLYVDRMDSRTLTRSG